MENVHIVELLLYTFSIVVLFSFIAILAGISQGHWFLRAMIPLAAVALLLPTGASEAVVAFLFQSWVIFGAICLARYYRKAKPSSQESLEDSPSVSSRYLFRFKLSDLLLAVAVIATSLAILGQATRTKYPCDWQAAMMVGLAIAVFPLSFFSFVRLWALLNKRPRIKGVGLSACVLIPLVSGLIVLTYSSEEINSIATEIFIISFVPSCIVLFVWLWRLTGWHPFDKSESSISPRVKFAGRLGLLTALLLLLLPTAIIYRHMAKSQPSVAQNLPKPNAYVELILVSRQIEQLKAPIVGFDPSSSFKPFIVKAGPALEQARGELDKPCRVVLDYSPLGLLEWRNSPHDPSVLRFICRGFDVEAEIAMREGRIDDAISNALDCVDLAQQGERGGLTFHFLISAANEGIGVSRLRKIKGDLNLNQIREIIHQLHLVNVQREPIELVIEREENWTNHVYGWKHRYLDFFHVNLHAFPENAILINAKRRDAKLRLLMTELSLRAYHLENEKYPKNLKELSPDYLARVPLDPFSSKRQMLRYRLEGEKYLLYCVGQNGKDDGGQRVTQRQYFDGLGDFFFDMLDETKPNASPSGNETEAAKENSPADNPAK